MSRISVYGKIVSILSREMLAKTDVGDETIGRNGRTPAFGWKNNDDRWATLMNGKWENDEGSQSGQTISTISLSLLLGLSAWIHLLF